jgi:ubiquinone/menaquinone biosynthesis C-methylase UbiE
MIIRPREIIDILSKNGFIKKGDKVAEFGCGGGYFTILLAKQVGDIGKIYAIDILEDSIKETQELADLYEVNNIEYLISDVKNLPYEDNYFDLVFISNVLFQNEGYDKILESALRIVKEGGFVVVLEPNKKLPFLYGVPIPVDVVRTFFNVKNKKILFQKIFGDNYYLIVAEK